MQFSVKSTEKRLSSNVCPNDSRLFKYSKFFAFGYPHPHMADKLDGTASIKRKILIQLEFTFKNIYFTCIYL
jgi:hypothetical protein